MNDKFNLDPISKGNDKDMRNTEDALDNAYNELYKSLGVEPGLLSKSSIGRKIEQKYRDDSIDTLAYAVTHVQNMNKDKKNYNTEIVKQSPLARAVTDEKLIIPDGDNVITLFGHKFIVIDENDPITTKADEVKDTLWQYIRKIQIRDKLTNEEVRKEIQTYLDKYDSNYFIGHINKNKEGE